MLTATTKFLTILIDIYLQIKIGTGLAANYGYIVNRPQ